MEWNQTFTIIGVNIGLFSIIGAILIYFLNKIDGDINRLDRRLDGHAARIDQLYQMFVDLLKERKK